MRSVHNRGQSPRGMSRLGTLIWLLLLAGGVYLGVKFVPPYWDYLSMLEPVKEAAMAAAVPGREERVRTELIARARGVGVELAEEDVEIFRNGNMVGVRVAWKAPVDLPRYRYTLRFRVESQSLAP